MRKKDGCMICYNDSAFAVGRVQVTTILSDLRLKIFWDIFNRLEKRQAIFKSFHFFIPRLLPLSNLGKETGQPSRMFNTFWL